MLLPPMPDTAAVFVAIDNAQRLVIGAAAFARANRMKPLVGPEGAVHVIQPCRRPNVMVAQRRIPPAP